jgi:hypothetical protein
VGRARFARGPLPPPRRLARKGLAIRPPPPCGVVQQRSAAARSRDAPCALWSCRVRTEVRGARRYSSASTPTQGDELLGGRHRRAGELLQQVTFTASKHGLRALGAWAKRFEKRRWAVEGASGLGRSVAQFLPSASSPTERTWSTCRRSFRRGSGYSPREKSERATGSTPSTPPSPLGKARAPALARWARRTWWPSCGCSLRGATTSW